jgi:pimeloyl-ACP methyl ester carboxylesterase
MTTTTVGTRLGALRVRTVGSGPPALLWHSLFVDSTTWCRVEEALAGMRRLVLVDGPAHGANGPVRRRFDLNDCPDVAVDVLDHLGIDEPVDWLGNAWGGHVGIMFAAAYPHRIRTLVAIGAPTHALTSAERRRIELLSVLYRIGGPAPVLKPLVGSLLGPDTWTTDPQGAAIVADAFRRADRRGMHAAIRGFSLARPDLTSTLAQIAAPTLLTTGVDDPMWTAASAASAVADLRDGALAILPGAGHVGPLLQAAPAVIDLVTAFWREPGAAVAGRRGRAATGSPKGI